MQVFPSDCMQSAVISVPVPSTHTLTYLIHKPFNETNELVLANQGLSKMSWTLATDSDDSDGNIAWFASPMAGTLDAFGEVVVKVVTRTEGLNARETPYTARFTLHSEDVCVCREQVRW